MASMAPHVYTELEEILRSFRCQDLVAILVSAGQSKNGKKQELLDRCISILQKGNPNIQMRIRELHK